MFVRLSFVLVIGLLSKFAVAQGKVVVTISNVKNDKGVCRTCLFNNAAAFQGEAGDPLQCLAITVKDKTAQGTFENVPAGKYAVMVFHDENNNNKMDKNFLGIPKEGYGASKNKLPFASAPTFNDNMFMLKDGATGNVLIRLRNL